VPDVVIDGVNGFAAEVGDVDALAGALLRTATDVELRKALKSRARASVEKYTWTDMLAPLEAMLDGLIQLPPKRQGQPALAWIEDLDGTHKVCFAAECLATTITDLRRRRAPLVRSLRVLQDMLEGASFVDCCRALALLRGYGYRSRD